MAFDENRRQTQNNALEKLDKVVALLAREDRWCKFFGVSSDRRRCLWGALWAEDAATILEVPVLHAIKQVAGRDYESIDAFNDHPDTTHAMVLAVPHQARQDLLRRCRLGGAISSVHAFRLACPSRGQFQLNSAL